LRQRPPRKRLVRILTRPPYSTERASKGWFTRLSRAQPHVVRQLDLTIAGWPCWRRPMRIAFLADFHTGSHADDIARLARIVAEAAAFAPDLALFGGDYVNMQMLGGGRVPPDVVAGILSQLSAPCGRYAVIGNHDVTYGADEVADALRQHGIAVLDDELVSLRFAERDIDLVGVPDARVDRPEARAVLAALPRDRPTVVLAHDPVWFGHVTSPAHLMLAGHTHGGQVRVPLFGALRNASNAPLRWSYGHIVEDGRQLCVTSGLGTSGIPLRIGIPPEFMVLDVNGPPGPHR
jgi:predicted MPP superfamily phosphohydrolase